VTLPDVICAVAPHLLTVLEDPIQFRHARRRFL